ncbi:MAG TPA: non-ribosomal peptide synthetase, partial [Stenotrophomonas sp.]|uniref:condensation domain-containing protein n=1 Tax=Stenotrophomonas sp. TaxID=69392 RepID=UPI000E8E2C7A
MTIIPSLLEQLRQLDARLTVQDGNLRIQSPRGPLPPVLREQLVAHKQELIVALGGGGSAAGDADTGAAIVPVDRSGPVPLSFAQQRLWTLDQLGADGATYAIHMGLRLCGAVDIAAMGSALDTLVHRHDILRSRYVAIDGQPMQVVDASAGCAFDAIAIDAADLDDRLAQHAALTFDLAAGPLFSAVLFTLGAQEHVLSLRMHHIVADGWSAGILLRELTHAYHAHAAATPPVLPVLPVQYGDFAVWQRGQVDAARLAAQLDYWRGHLAGAPDGLDLPTDGQRGPLQTYAGDLCAHPLPAALGPAVIQLARSHGCTPYVVLIAAFAVLLARLARQDDVVIGVPLAGRERRELSGLVGYFVNTQALRFALDMHEPFEAVLRRAVRTVADAQANQDVPFEQVVDALQVSRRPGQTPLFQVMFDLEAGADPAEPPPGDTALRVEPVRSPHTVAKFDLTLNMVQRGSAFSAQLEYNTDLFQANTIAGWVQAFDTLLEAAVAAPTTALVDLPLQSPAGVAQRVQASEGPRRLLQGDVVARFRARAAACPDAVALDGPAGQWTYAELERRSAHLATRLAAAGLAPGACIALSFQRSLEQVAAALAVLRAGLCYVPLDPALPAERAAFVVEDSGSVLLLTHAGLHPDARLPTWRLDGPWWEGAAAAGAAIDLPLHPLQSAYVIYTSGSTGRPKGVRIGHHALLNHAEAMAALFELSPQDRALQFSTFSFDMAVEEIFPTLLAGATLVLYDDRMGLDVEAFEGYLSRERITIANLPTAYWHLW